MLKIAHAVTDADEMEAICHEFGSKHVNLRSTGFRPDYFAR